MKSFIQKFVELGHRPNDPKDEKLKKSSLLVVSGPFALAGMVWGILYFSNGLIIPGAIPFSYSILSIINIISFGYSKQYKFFRNSQLFLILILPFALQVSLGGFVPSSAVIYWAIIAPAGALFFDSIKRSIYWFAAYLGLVVIAFIINDQLAEYVDWNLSEGFVNSLFLMNVIGISSIIFGILYYFVSTVTKLNNHIEKKNEVLKEQSEKLKEMDKVKSRFFANISHEFRTPLTLIQGLIKKQIDHPDKPAKPKELRTIQRNSNQLLQLINQLLDLSKLESGNLKLEAAKDDLASFVKSIAAAFESAIADKDIALTFNGYPFDKMPALPTIELYFDHEKMQQVFTNLISNAVKFTPSGETISLEVELDQIRKMAIVRVINTGTEIPREKQAHIFDRFYQIDDASNRKFEGTGIGLALVKELVELHHGQVSVDSKMRKTCFTAMLPLDSSYLKRAEMVGLKSVANRIKDVDLQPEVKNEKATIDNKEMEILIVEDNRDLREFIHSILEEDYKLIEAVDGVDGLEKAISYIPDLIVSDVMMPRMDGYDLCKKLKSNDKTNHIPVVLLTAKASRENKLEGLETGADDYLVKPFDQEELLVRIKNLITIRAQLQEKFKGVLNLKPREVEVTSVQQQFIENLKEIIEENMDNEAFSVDDMGKAIGMSRSQLHRKLKAITDQSATTFIRNYRLHRAADLLSKHAGSVTEIAYRVGFSSQTYFSSRFQELFGQTPSAFLKSTEASESPTMTKEKK